MRPRLLLVAAAVTAALATAACGASSTPTATAPTSAPTSLLEPSPPPSPAATTTSASPSPTLIDDSTLPRYRRAARVVGNRALFAYRDVAKLPRWPASLRPLIRRMLD